MSKLLNALPIRAWKTPPLVWIALGLVGIATVAAFYPGLAFMVQNWDEVAEYSYGYLIPVIVAFLIWQKADVLRLQSWEGAWSGLALVFLALLLRLAGDLSAIRVITQYGFVIALYGIAVCLLGWRTMRLVAVPLAVTLFMIPLPQFVLREMSQQLQLLSSQLGVSLIRLCQISVYLEGNVIDLGPYKLQVVEACSGLRYLFPLMALGFLAAYFFKGAMWKRAIIFVSTIPLTIIINSLRIGLIGVTVEYWGVSMAEGLLHDFEGWFMFMICVALLVGEMTLLAWLGPKGRACAPSSGWNYPPIFPRTRKCPSSASGCHWRLRVC
jgi:exosortase D (VPLPA-CTERM-specific)